MAKTNVRAFGVAACAAFSLGALPAAGHAAGGTIKFVGAIVVDSFEGVVTPRAQVTSTSATAKAKAATATATAGAYTVEIALQSKGNERKKVNLSTVAVDGTTLATQCAPTGMAPSPSAAGSCRLGPDGGRMILTALGQPRSGVAPAAVMVMAYD